MTTLTDGLQLAELDRIIPPCSDMCISPLLLKRGSFDFRRFIYTAVSPNDVEVKSILVLEKYLPCTFDFMFVIFIPDSRRAATSLKKFFVVMKQQPNAKQRSVVGQSSSLHNYLINTIIL